MSAQLVHMGVPDCRPALYWWARIERRSRYSTVNELVIDRLHWSEDVYGWLFRCSSDVSDRERVSIETWLSFHKCVVVLCLPPRLVTIKNAEKEGGDQHHERAGDVWDAFNAGWRTTLPVIRYDYTVNGAPDILEERRRAYADVRDRPFGSRV